MFSRFSRGGQGKGNAIVTSIGPDLEWLLRQLRRYLTVYVASVACLTSAALLSLVDPLVMRWLIDTVLPQKDVHRLIVAACIFVLIYVSRLLLSNLSGLLDLRATQATVLRLRSSLYRKLNILSAEYHEERPAGDSQFRIEQDVSQIGELGTDFLVTTVRLLTVSGLTLITMFILDPALTAAVLPLIPPFILLRRRYQTRLRAESEAVQSRSARRSCFLQEYLPAVVQVQLLGLENSSALQFFRLAKDAMNAIIHRKKSEIVFGIGSISFMFVGFGVLLGYGGDQVLRGVLTIGGLVAFYTYASRLFEPLVNVVDIDIKVHRMRVSVRRVLEVLNNRPTVRNISEAVRLHGETSGILDLENVGFGYCTDKQILVRLSFTARPGEKLAIVGRTGSGKSTIAKLITRQYEVQQGAIKVDSTDIRKITLASLRAAISLVPQEPILFNGTLRENLLVANCNATQRELAEIAELTQITEFLHRLPKQWDAAIGPHGVRLSGGEKQRVALARAVLRNPKILILDESTSALDAETEKRVLIGLENFMGGRTVIVISHRLSTILWADRVVVLGQGRVVAEGTQCDLSGKKSFHERLYERDRFIESAQVPEVVADEDQLSGITRSLGDAIHS
jgi:ABC-type bacteriocin/lantibiotic exporter with double-glycine peptidase domain